MESQQPPERLVLEDCTRCQQRRLATHLVERILQHHHLSLVQVTRALLAAHDFDLSLVVHFPQLHHSLGSLGRLLITQ